MIPWLVAAAALFVALAAWRQARRTAARLDHLSQLYWELKYRQGEIRLQAGRAAGAPAAPPDPPGDDSVAAGGATPPAPAVQAFVPLVSLKR